MVKFGKELEAKLIPEWKEEFINYWQLKKEIKKMKLKMIATKFKSSGMLQPQSHHHDWRCGSFFNLAGNLLRFCRLSNTTTQIIHQVRRRSTEEGEKEMYQTQLAQLFSEEDEVTSFFRRLDGEVNKVNQFYKSTEMELVERGEILNKQLQVLLDIKQVLSERGRKTTTTTFFPPASSSANSTSLSGINSKSREERELACCETTSQVVMAAAMEWNGVNMAAGKLQTEKEKPKINCPISGLAWEGLLNNLNKEDVDPTDLVNPRKLRCAQKMIRSAFVELYRGLALLETYGSSNMVAFAKILKKFDKVSNQKASEGYLKEVKRSHFMTSDKVYRLMDEVETLFTEHFANNDKKIARKFLRPQQEIKDSHMLTFLVGLFTGCFISLFSIYVVMAHMSGIFSSNSGSVQNYIETVYPIFSVFALLNLHLFMYGCNLFMWMRTRINYAFIFEFSPNTALRYIHVFLICATSMTIVVGALVIHLSLRARGFSASHVDTIPGFLLLIFLLLLICPFDIFYRPTRYYFIRIIRNIVSSPLYKVQMVDFFMADQLTSQISLLRYLESAVCYFMTGSFRTHKYETCKKGKMYRQLTYVLSFLPYYWRAMQCARRWFDESDMNHLANMGKYVSAMVAAGARLTYAQQSDRVWFGIVLLTSIVATVYQLYWDFVKDWGLLNPNSKNPWLRDDLILKSKFVYFLSIAFNAGLRVAWVEAVMRFQMNSFQSHLLHFFLASLEVIRRGHWNFYRLENEHFNNVGKFRAVIAVPLPFCERERDSDARDRSAQHSLHTNNT